MRRVAFIGYGDLAHAFALALREAGVDVVAYVRPPRSASAQRARQRRMREAGVQALRSPAAALDDADTVIAAVPASASADALAQCLPHLARGQLYVDPTSGTPSAKHRAASRVERAGCEYADVAVLGTVVTAGGQVPMLAAGSGAARWAEEGAAVGFDISAMKAEPGSAALVKLLRSVFMKGRDALILEMVLAARRHGVQDAVLASIAGPGEDVSFEALTERVLCSLTVYAERRADELSSVVPLLREVGVDAIMTRAGERRLRRLADSGVAERFAGERPSQVAEVLSSLDELYMRLR